MRYVFRSLFIFLVTLLLVVSLPEDAFPDPRDPAIPSPIPAPPEWLWQQDTFFDSLAKRGSKFLIQRWATFLGITGTLLAAGQYIPQIIYTFRAKLVGSLSIPMMCLQVPGSVIFVYSVSLCASLTGARSLTQIAPLVNSWRFAPVQTGPRWLHSSQRVCCSSSCSVSASPGKCVSPSSG